MTRTINYGLIGCGMMGQEHLHNIALIEATRVSAIFEPDTDMADIARRISPGSRMVASITD